MATENFNNWVVDGVPFNITATTGTVTRTSATQFKVVINASWTCTGTVWGVQVTSGGGTADIPLFDGKVRKNGSGSLTGTFNTSTNVAATKNIEVTFKIYDDRNHSATKTLTLPSVSVPAWTSYTIKYDANGGNGAPGNQTKWHGQNLIVSSVVPTKAGHTFRGWALSKADADAGRWYYQPGSTCGQNNDLTLYAVWEAHTYQVTYDANGGTLAGESYQIKTYGQTLTLTGTATRENYNFLGWGTSASATIVTYAAGGSYTANAGATLYAVWELAYVKPRITNFTTVRCDYQGNVTDDGTYLSIRFDWNCDRPVVSIIVNVYDAEGNPVPDHMGDTDGFDYTPDTDGVTSGSEQLYVYDIVNMGFDAADPGPCDTDKTYTVRVTVTDQIDSYSKSATVNGLVFPIDFLAGGKGASFGKPAEIENVLDVGFQTYLRGGLRYGVLENNADLNNQLIPGFYVGSHLYSYANCPLDSGHSFTLEVMSGGDIGQLTQRLTQCNMDHPVTYERAYYELYWGEWLRTSPFSVWETMIHTPSAANTFERVGSIIIPKYRTFSITARGMRNNAQCRGVVMGQNADDYHHSFAACFNYNQDVHFPSCTYSGNTGGEPLTIYLWGSWVATNPNSIEVSGFYMPY